MNYDLQRTSQHEFELVLTEEKLDILDAAIEHATSTPQVTKLTIVCSPQIAMKHKDLLFSRGFEVSGSRTKDCKILLTFSLIVKRSGDGGVSPSLTVTKAPYENQAIAESVRRADEILARFSGAPDLGVQ